MRSDGKAKKPEIPLNVIYVYNLPPLSPQDILRKKMIRPNFENLHKCPPIGKEVGGIPIKRLGIFMSHCWIFAGSRKVRHLLGYYVKMGK